MTEIITLKTIWDANREQLKEDLITCYNTVTTPYNIPIMENNEANAIMILIENALSIYLPLQVIVNPEKVPYYLISAICRHVEALVVEIRGLMNSADFSNVGKYKDDYLIRPYNNANDNNPKSSAIHKYRDIDSIRDVVEHLTHRSHFIAKIVNSIKTLVRLYY